MGSGESKVIKFGLPKLLCQRQSYSEKQRLKIRRKKQFNISEETISYQATLNKKCFHTELRFYNFAIAFY